MTTVIEPLPHIIFAGGPRLLRISAATDGKADSDHALTTAVALAKTAGAAVDIVSVCEIIIGHGDLDPPMFPSTELLEDPSATRARRLALVQEQLNRVFGREDAFDVTVRFGVTGSEIAAFSKEKRADLIVTGRGRHRLLDRILGEEHLVRLLRTTECPVLAVEPGTREPPRAILIGLDLSERDEAVLNAVALLAPNDARLYFVHVKPDPVAVGFPVPDSFIDDYDNRVRAIIERSRKNTALANFPNVETRLLSGHAGIELNGFARRVNADVVAVGIHGAGFVHRTIVGSATTYLLRAVEASLLAVPTTGKR